MKDMKASSTNSGHYKPSPDQMAYVANILNSRGAGLVLDQNHIGTPQNPAYRRYILGLLNQSNAFDINSFRLRIALHELNGWVRSYLKKEGATEADSTELPYVAGKYQLYMPNFSDLGSYGSLRVAGRDTFYIPEEIATPESPEFTITQLTFYDLLYKAYTGSSLPTGNTFSSQSDSLVFQLANCSPLPDSTQVFVASSELPDRDAPYGKYGPTQILSANIALSGSLRYQVDTTGHQGWRGSIRNYYAYNDDRWYASDSLDSVLTARPLLSLLKPYLRTASGWQPAPSYQLDTATNTVTVQLDGSVKSTQLALFADTLWEEDTKPYAGTPKILATVSLGADPVNGSLPYLVSQNPSSDTLLLVVSPSGVSLADYQDKPAGYAGPSGGHVLHHAPAANGSDTLMLPAGLTVGQSYVVQSWQLASHSPCGQPIYSLLGSSPLQVEATTRRVGTPPRPADRALLLHPNPQQAGHRLSAHNPTSGPARYTLYSAQGQQLSQHQVAPGQSLSLSLSSPGLYSVRIETVTGTYWQKLSVY